MPTAEAFIAVVQSRGPSTALDHQNAWPKHRSGSRVSRDPDVAAGQEARGRRQGLVGVTGRQVHLQRTHLLRRPVHDLATDEDPQPETVRLT